MEFKCDKDWDKMSVTQDPNIRHCQLCQKDVHFCHTLEDLDNAINAKHCVAFVSISAEIDSTLKSFVENLEEQKSNADSEKLITRTLGLPRGYNKGKSFLELDDKE